VADEKQLYGNFHSALLDQVLRDYYDILPLSDLPSDKMLNLILLLLRSLFGSLEEDHEYRWIGDRNGGEEDPQTGITILVADTVDQEVVEQRPAILVKLGSRQFMALHLDQQRHWNSYYNSRALQDLISGTMTLSVVSQSEAIARRLAEWVGLNLRIFAHNLTFGGFHAVYPQVQMTPTRPAPEFVRGSSDHEYVVAQVLWQFTWNWVAHVISTSTKKVGSIEVTQLVYESPSLDVVDGQSGTLAPAASQQLLIEPAEE
jgi:hypothetical protein